MHAPINKKCTSGSRNNFTSGNSLLIWARGRKGLTRSKVRRLGKAQRAQHYKPTLYPRFASEVEKHASNQKGHSDERDWGAPVPLEESHV